MVETPPEKVRWPRFDVVEMRWQGEARARYAIMDYLTKAVRFGLDPFSKTLAFELMTELHRQANAAGEPTVVLRSADAVQVRKPVKPTVEKERIRGKHG
jgi:hypothetical protein